MRGGVAALRSLGIQPEISKAAKFQGIRFVSGERRLMSRSLMRRAGDPPHHFGWFAG